jgi:prolyl-tRNA synthetase
MKDGYSFHTCYEDMIKEFNIMEQTYKNIFTKLGLDFRVVEADSGAIGGSGSKEFHVLANSGEDTIVICKECDYAANIETAMRQSKTITYQPLKKEKVYTPNLKSIQEVSEFLNIDKSQFIKAVIKKAIFEENEEVIVFFVRGDDELEETKAKNAVNAIDLIEANEKDIEQANLIAGFIGPFNLDVRVIIDNELKNHQNLVCGANENDYHITGFELDDSYEYANLAMVKEGDKCCKCGGELIYKKGIEVGHIFQLGEVYSKPLNATFLDENGKAKPFVMGTYGIGVSRLVAAIIEQNHDDRGCIWTKTTTPFMVDIIVSNAKNKDELNIATKIYEDLLKENIEVIIDDRVNARFGFKMSDFELIGFRYGIIVGKKIKDNLVEIVDRKTLSKTEVNLNQIIKIIKELI